MYEAKLDPVFGLLIFMVLDLVVLVLALFYASVLGSWQWVAHTIAILLLLASPILLDELTIPKIAANEAPGPGDGVFLVPLLGELVFIGAVYASFFIVKFFRIFERRIQRANAKLRDA